MTAEQAFAGCAERQFSATGNAIVTQVTFASNAAFPAGSVVLPTTPDDPRTPMAQTRSLVLATALAALCFAGACGSDGTGDPPPPKKPASSETSSPPTADPNWKSLLPTTTVRSRSSTHSGALTGTRTLTVATTRNHPCWTAGLRCLGSTTERRRNSPVETRCWTKAMLNTALATATSPLT